MTEGVVTEDLAQAVDVLENLIGKAKKAGADAADAVLVTSAGISHAQRLGEIEKLERAESRDLGLRVFIGRRQAIVSSTDFDPATLDALVERGVAMARAVPEDPHAGLADSDQVAKDFPTLEINDPEEPSPETLIDWARAAEDAARAVDGITNSEGAEASWGRTGIALAASNGFAGAYQRSGFGISASVIAGEGTAMESDYEWSSAVFRADLDDPAKVGRTAGERAVKRLNPRKVETAKVPVVYDPRVSGGILGHLLSAINGSAVSRGTTFLKDELGKQVFAKGLTIVDDPHRPRGLRSKPFDGEGVANAKTKIVRDGMLETWLLDLRSARQLGLSSTGHGARGTSGPPSPSATNVYLEPGAVTPDALIGEIDQGLYITELIGFGINGVTGDYSRGASGYWIENGVLGDPVSEVTVAGNLKDMFLNLAPANDLVFRYGVDAPTLRIDGMTVAGA